MKRVGRFLFLIAGIISLGLAALGAVLPILPTTPFALVAVICFSRSSEKMHQWILNTPLVGQGVRDWQESRVIRLRAKIMASVGAALLLLPTFWFFEEEVPNWLKFASAVVLGLALGWVWTRSSKLPQEPQSQVPAQPPERHDQDQAP